MIYVQEKVAFTHDDPLLPECSKALTKENGWRRSEDTVAVVFVRETWNSIGVKDNDE